MASWIFLILIGLMSCVMKVTVEWLILILVRVLVLGERESLKGGLMADMHSLRSRQSKIYTMCN